MTRPPIAKGSVNANTATLPDANRAQARQQRRREIVRRLASFPALFYSWASGPAVNNVERDRAAVADAKNLLGKRF